MSVDFDLIIKITKKLDSSLMRYAQGNFSSSKETFLEESFFEIDLPSKLHPSHIDELYKTAPSSDREKIKQYVKKHASIHLKKFLENDILDKLSYYMPVLPYKFLDDFEAKTLLLLDAEDMQHLAHFLGLYDLKASLKTLIDPKLILKIQEVLTPDMRQFLKIIQSEKDKISFKKIELETWDQKKDSLLKLLYVRGLNRIAKAISQESVYTVNEILLRLPFKDKALFTTLNSEIDPALKPYLSEQVNQAYSYIKNHQHP
jgi:hypothetical protein